MEPESPIETTLDAIRQDPEIAELLGRFPKEVADSFSTSQLVHLKNAVGARSWGKHKIDLRSSFRLWRYRYYFVFVAGRNRRAMTAREKMIDNFLTTAIVTGSITLSVLAGLLVLYLIKSAMGIDIFPNYSFGIWHWFRDTFL